MKRKSWQLLAVLTSLILVVLLLATACAKQAPAPAPAPAPSPTPAPAPAPSPTPTPSPAPTPAAPIELKFSDPMPPQGRMAWGIFEVWAKEMEELTNGRVKVTVYSGGVLGGIPEQYNLALTGTADIAASDPTNTPGVFPRADVTTLPLLCKSNEAVSIAFWELMNKYMINTEFKDVKVIWTHCTGGSQLFTRTKQVRTVEDWKGMKIAAQSPIQTEVIKAFGAVPVFMIQPEIYTALERGMIDGQLFDWEGAVVFRIPEVTKYRTGNVDLSTRPMVMVMNTDVWNKLPPDIQKIIDDNGMEWSKRFGGSWDEVKPAMIKNFEDYDKEAGNPPIYYITEDERARWRQTVQPVIDGWISEMEAKGIPAKAMVADLESIIAKYTK